VCRWILNFSDTFVLSLDDIEAICAVGLGIELNLCAFVSTDDVIEIMLDCAKLVVESDDLFNGIIIQV